MRDFERKMRMAAMMGGLEDLFEGMGDPDGDSAETRRKDPGQIFAEAQTTGLKDQIRHLHGSIRQFHDEVVKQDEKIKAAEKEQDSLREKLSDSENKADALKYKNVSLVHENGNLQRSVDAYSGRLSEVEKAVAQKSGTIQDVIDLLNGMTSNPGKGDYQTCFKKVMELLISSNGDEAAASSAEGETDISPESFDETHQQSAGANA